MHVVESTVLGVVMSSCVMEFGAAVEEAISFMNFQPLKPKQVEAVKSFTSGHDTFVALQTGYGKSIIYAILPRLFDNLLG